MEFINVRPNFHLSNQDIFFYAKATKLAGHILNALHNADAW